MGHVVLFQCGILTPVHDRVEVEVEDGLLSAGQTAADHGGVEGGEEPPLVVVGEAVGVVGQRGFLGQDRQPGEQGAAAVEEQVVDVGDPAGAGELEREQGQQPAHGGDGGRAGVAGLGHQAGQVEGDQVGHDQQQPGELGVEPVGERGEVDDPGRGQAGVAAGGGGVDAGAWFGSA